MENCVIPQGYKATALGIIPQEWEVKTLGNIAKINPSKGKITSKVVTFLAMSDISEQGGVINENILPIDSIKPGLTPFRKGDVIIAKITPCFENGKGALLDKITEDDGFGSTEFHVIRCQQDNKFVYYHTQSYAFRKRLESQMTGSAGQKRVPADSVAAYKIPVPPLAEQRKIAEVLGVWDEAIEKQARLIEKLALRKRGLMQRLLSAKLRLPGFSEPWQKVNYSDMLKEVRRTLTWDENELYDLISVRRRSGGVFHRESLYGHEIKTKTLRPALEGDFLISKMQIVHGASGVVPKQLSGMKISGSYIALIAKDPKELNINYFNLWSQMPLFYHQTFVSSYGVHIEKMTFDLDAFMSLSMNLPPIEEQDRIVEIILTATNEIELAKEKLDRLRRQKRGLMQQLLTGKKRIKF